MYYVLRGVKVMACLESYRAAVNECKKHRSGRVLWLPN